MTLSPKQLAHSIAEKQRREAVKLPKPTAEPTDYARFDCQKCGHKLERGQGICLECGYENFPEELCYEVFEIQARNK